MEVILIRHGEPYYEDIRPWGKVGLGFELGKLTELGIEQAEKVSHDEQLKGAQLIISSPYTRALQTAAIVSKNIGLDIAIETDLHEWFMDTTFKFDVKVEDSYDAYIKNRGIINEGENYVFEEYEVIKKRVHDAVLKYKHLDKVIVVCHGIVMSAFTHFDDLIEHCGIRIVNL